MNLTAVTGDIVDERKVKPSETVVLSGEQVRAGDLASLRIFPRISPDEQDAAELIHANGAGKYLTLPRGAVLTVGESTWLVSDLVEFELTASPAPVEPVRPYREGTYRVHYADGHTDLLEGVERFEDLAGWEFVEGIARPPREAVMA